MADSTIYRPISPQMNRSLAVALKGVDTDPYRKQFTEQFYFPREIKFLLENRTGIEQFVDVGANIGHFSLAAGLLDLRTFSVEALAENFSLLRQSVALNRFASVTPYYAAASSEFGTVSMGGHAAWGEVNSSSGNVPAVVLDGILPLYGFDVPDLIKIDVEGHEIQVLDGLRETIERCKPLLVFESNSWAARSSGGHMTLINKVRSFGYDLFMYINDGTVTPFAENDIQHISCTDYLAVPRGPNKARALPTIRGLSIDERISMVEQDVAYNEEAHRWHFGEMLEGFRSRYGNNERLDAIEDSLKDPLDCADCETRRQDAIRKLKRETFIRENRVEAIRPGSGIFVSPALPKDLL